MASARVRIGVLFGRQSGEHEISLASARSVIAALDPVEFAVVPISISCTGQWLAPAASEALLAAGPTDGGAGDSETNAPGVALVERAARLPAALNVLGGAVDVVFPVLHGPYGEDGTIQGLLELAGVPYVGAGVLGSAVGMDKIAMKMIFAQAGLPVGEWAVLRPGTATLTGAQRERLGLPVFVKPARA